MPISWDARNKRWRFQFNRVLEGQRVRASRLLPQAWSRTQADAYDRKESARLYGLASGVEPQRVLIEDAVAKYLEHRATKLRGGRKYAQELAHLVPYIEGRYLDELPAVAAAFVRDFPDLAPATLRNRLAYLRAAVNYARKKHGIGRGQDYTEAMELPAVDNDRHVYLRLEDVQALLAALPERSRPIFALAFWTGMRWRSDILTLTPEKIVRDGRDVWIHTRQTKQGTPLMVFVPPEARWALDHVPFPWREKAYYEDWWKVIEDRDLVPHDLRHSLASALISTGSTLKEVQAVLGHGTPISTNRYAHLYPEVARSAVMRMAKKRPTTRKPSKKAAA